MSLLAFAAKSAITAGVTRLLGGGNGGPNIAKKVSSFFGCQIQQTDANQAWAIFRKGVNPCTGQPDPRSPAAKAGPAPILSTPTRLPAPVQRTLPTAAPTVESLTRQVLGNVTQQAGQAILRQFTSKEDRARSKPQFNQATGQFETPSLITGRVPTGREITQAKATFVARPPQMSLMTSMSALPAIARGAGGLLRTSTGRISRIVLPSGQTFTRRSAANLIRRVGFEAAAVALGIGIVEAAELLLTDSQTRRRRRGITGAQLATTKRTICTLKRMAADVGIKSAPVRRRRTCR